MNILVNGVGRTGTELLCGIFKLISIRNKININAIKVHLTSHKRIRWSDLICSTKRDLREIIASTKRYTGKPYVNGGKNPQRYSIKDECFFIVKQYRKNNKRSSFEFVYETFLTDKRLYIKQAFNFVDIKPSEDDIDFIIDGIKKPFKNDRHITNKKHELITYDKTLTKDEITEIYSFMKSSKDPTKEKLIYLEDIIDD